MLGCGSFLTKASLVLLDHLLYLVHNKDHYCLVLHLVRHKYFSCKVTKT